MFQRVMAIQYNCQKVHSHTVQLSKKFKAIQSNSQKHLKLFLQENIPSVGHGDITKLTKKRMKKQ